MLLLTPRGEVEMSQQRSWVETGSALWVVRLWERIDPAKRQEVLAVLAEMARDSLFVLAQGNKEGKNHES